MRSETKQPTLRILQIRYCENNTNLRYALKSKEKKKEKNTVDR